MNTDFNALSVRLQQLEQDNTMLRSQFQTERKHNSSERRRLRIQAGLAFVALIGALFLSPANRSAFAQSYGVTLQQLLGRVTVVEAKNTVQDITLSSLQSQIAAIQLTPGPQGPAGPQGAMGTPGMQGAMGLQGPQGTMGAPGLPGAVGPKGNPGMMGAPGAMGATGATGPTGVAGRAGMMGATGPAGTMGAAGVRGPAGVAGPAGMTGAVQWEFQALRGLRECKDRRVCRVLVG